MHIGVCFPSGRGSLLVLSAAAHAGGPGCSYGLRLGPGQAPRHACSGRSKSHQSGRVIAGRPSAELYVQTKAKQDNGIPHTAKKNEHNMCWHVSSLLLCVAARTSSVVTRPPGHLAPRPSSRVTAVTLRARCFVPRCILCVCTLCIRGRQMETSHNQRVQLFLLRDYCCGSIY